MGTCRSSYNFFHSTFLLLCTQLSTQSLNNARIAALFNGVPKCTLQSLHNDCFKWICHFKDICLSIYVYKCSAIFECVRFTQRFFLVAESGILRVTHFAILKTNRKLKTPKWYLVCSPFMCQCQCQLSIQIVGFLSLILTANHIGDIDRFLLGDNLIDLVIMCRIHRHIVTAQHLRIERICNCRHITTASRQHSIVEASAVTEASAVDVECNTRRDNDVNVGNVDRRIGASRLENAKSRSLQSFALHCIVNGEKLQCSVAHVDARQGESKLQRRPQKFRIHARRVNFAAKRHERSHCHASLCCRLSSSQLVHESNAR